MTDNERDTKLKALREDCAQSVSPKRIDNEPTQPGLRERVSLAALRAQREARRAQHLAELEALLIQYPDIARILDLVEELRDRI